MSTQEELLAQEHQERQAIRKELLAQIALIPDIPTFLHTKSRMLFHAHEILEAFIQRDGGLDLVLEHAREHVAIIEALIAKRDALQAAAQTVRGN